MLMIIADRELRTWNLDPEIYFYKYLLIVEHKEDTRKNAIIKSS